MATKQKINLSVPGSTAITDGKGVLKQEWRLWFNKIYQRLGGDAAYSNTDLEDFIININSQVDTINTTITTLQTELNNVSDEIILIQNNITTINDNITILQNSITDINNNINTINNSITTINNSITTINTTLSSLTTQVNTNTSDIATLNSSVIKTIASVGAGISIWLSKVGNTANFKSLKAGTNITLDNTTNPNEIVINSTGGTSYTLPPATTTTLGGVIIPSSGNLLVDGSGNLSVPVASSSVLGLVKVDGTTITITGGVISAVSSGGGVNEGSDARDKADITYNTDLGLDFIKKLKPAQWRWDLRDDYRKTTYTEDGEIVVYFEPKDGSKKRKRLHNGFIAQDLQDIILQTGIDFAGFQDHNIDNGNDVLSVGYDEFIAPIVKAIQEQQQIIDKQQQQINDLQNILQKLTEKVGV